MITDKIDKQQEDHYEDEKREEFVERSKSEGLEVLFPGEGELLIDLDSEEALTTFKDLWKILCKNAEEIINGPYEIWRSKGEVGYHVRINLFENLGVERRILFQAVLGSDPKRELLSLIRSLHGDSDPTLLVEDPEK